MNLVENIYFLKMNNSRYNEIKYFLSLIIILIVFSVASVYITFSITGKKVFWKIYTNIFSEKKVYLLYSETNENWLKQINANPKEYKKRVFIIRSNINKVGYNPIIINESQIYDVRENNILFIVDTFALKESTIVWIKNFLKKGGKVVFNWYTGLNNELFSRRKKMLIEEISNAKYIKDFSSKEKIFLATNCISPITFKIPCTKIELVLYDSFPIFNFKDKADAMLANWAMLPQEEIENSKAIWHGKYGKGKYVYLSFPFYAIVDIAEQKKDFLKILKGIFKYFSEEPTVIVFPFVDSSQVTAFCADTEFMYKNILKFQKLVESNKIKATVFSVAKLAKNNFDITKTIGKSDYIEIASHTFSHKPLKNISKKEIIYETQHSKEILQSIIGKEVKSFRPPMEKYDKKTLEILSKIGYKSILGSSEKRSLLPYNFANLLVIPRQGNDDYYFATKNKSKLLNIILKEQEFTHMLGGCYTFVVHTHLFLNSEIELLDKFIKESLKKGVNFFTIEEIRNKSLWKKNINISVLDKGELVVLKVNNKSPKRLNNVHIRIFWNSQEREILSIIPEIVGMNPPKFFNHIFYSDIILDIVRPISTVEYYLKVKSL